MIQESVVVPIAPTSIEIAYRKWIRAKVAGIFNATVSNGAQVKKGSVLGYIMDTYGETKFPVKAPFDGFILAKNYFPIINMGDPLFHFGYL